MQKMRSRETPSKKLSCFQMEEKEKHKVWLGRFKKEVKQIKNSPEKHFTNAETL